VRIVASSATLLVSSIWTVLIRCRTSMLRIEKIRITMNSALKKSSKSRNRLFPSGRSFSLKSGSQILS
jgi:hypothetical protein